MRQNPFYVRCYAKRTGDQWVAICIDLCLAVQGDSCDEVKAKLEAQVNDYVFEALTVDRQYANDLLSRKAPLKNRAEYHMIRLAQMFYDAARMRKRAFQELVTVPA